MGPRLFRRGNLPRSCIIGIFLFGFNGATSFQTWKRGNDMEASGCRIVLQWGHVFSDVETLCACLALASSSCFNGATSFQTWKLDAPVLACAALNSFNGATSFQTWKHIVGPGPFIRQVGFNGATSFQTWKPRWSIRNSRHC